MKKIFKTENIDEIVEYLNLEQYENLYPSDFIFDSMFYDYVSIDFINKKFKLIFNYNNEPFLSENELKYYIREYNIKNFLELNS